MFHRVAGLLSGTHPAEGETYYECRACGKGYFGEEPPQGDPSVFAASGGGGGPG